MVLVYKFEYLSNNSVLINNLHACAKKYDLEYTISKENNLINLFVEGSLEVLNVFSNELSHSLPMSIFIKNVEVESVEEFPNVVSETSASEFPLSFCKKCLTQVENKKDRNYYNPFLFCSHCGQDLKTNELILFEGKKEIKKSNNIEYFESVAQYIHNGKRVKIRTLSGEFIFFKIDEKVAAEDNIKLLCTDLNALQEFFTVSKEEVIALACIEKPAIMLHINEATQAKNIFKEKRLNVRYVNDLFLYLLSLELEKYAIKFLAYTQKGEFDYSFTFSAKKEYKEIPIPEISVSDNGQILVLNSRDYDEKLNVAYQQFNEKDKAQFMVLLSENQLLNKSVLNFYISSKHSDGTTLYSPKIDGMLDIFNVQLPPCIEDVFNTIKEEPLGSTLVTNYQKAFPELFEKALCFDTHTIQKNSVYGLWSMVCVILGFEEDMLTLASDVVLKKGPRVDYQLNMSDKIFKRQLNIAKVIQSGISYKLAGTSANVIALGYIESFAEFISRCVDEVEEEMSLDGISFCGDLCANRVISHFIDRSITKKHKIYYNKDFPIQINE
ncbi:MAG: hypothetical protein ACNI3C_12000 [Candidatus Marinarcus sp.]|uniref:hypothetical protein n=1 Tax=Candidatus Marinarcus sp. TaxID=3100987 RepID=UPI003AFF8123